MGEELSEGEEMTYCNSKDSLGIREAASLMLTKHCDNSHKLANLEDTVQAAQQAGEYLF